MKKYKTNIKDLFFLKSTRFNDKRGFLRELVKEKCGNQFVDCLQGVSKSFWYNWPQYWFVETWGDDSVLIERLPVWYKILWYRVSANYHWLLIFSGVAAVTISSKKKPRNLFNVVGLLLIPSYIFAVCILGNRYDWYEGGRLKFFLEPTFFVLIATQMYMAKESISFLYSKLSNRQK